MKRIHTMGGALAAALIGFCGCRPPGGGQGPVDAGPVSIGQESVFRVRKADIQAGPRIAGTLEPAEQARVRAEVGGSVMRVEVDLGDVVKKGQLLARIEDRPLRDAYASAKSAVSSAEEDLRLAKRQLERTQKLVAAGALAEQDLESARSAAAGAEARLAQARAQLASTQNQLEGATVRAPINGVVSERAVNQGDIVAPGAALFTLIDPSSMRLQASVPADALGMLEVGKPVTFQVRGYGNQRFTGEIQQIAPAADPVTRQITVLVSIPNPGGRLISGLFAEGRVAAQSRNALVVPASAVEVSNGRATVKRVSDGRVEEVEVEPGLRDTQTERVEILEGLREGDLVLTGAARTVSPGTPVQVAPESGAAQR